MGLKRWGQGHNKSPKIFVSRLNFVSYIIWGIKYGFLKVGPMKYRVDGRIFCWKWPTTESDRHHTTGNQLCFGQNGAISSRVSSAFGWTSAGPESRSVWGGGRMHRQTSPPSLLSEHLCRKFWHWRLATQMWGTCGCNVSQTGPVGISPDVEDMVGHVLVERPLCGQDLPCPGQVFGNDIHLARNKPGTDRDTKMNGKQRLCLSPGRPRSCPHPPLPCWCRQPQ